MSYYRQEKTGKEKLVITFYVMWVGFVSWLIFSGKLPPFNRLVQTGIIAVHFLILIPLVYRALK